MLSSNPRSSYASKGSGFTRLKDYLHFHVLCRLIHNGHDHDSGIKLNVPQPMNRLGKYGTCMQWNTIHLLTKGNAVNCNNREV